MAVEMQRVFQNFIDQLATSRDTTGLHSAIRNAATAFEIQCFAYLMAPRDDRQVAALISDYPIAWTDRYLKRHYERLDPVIMSARIRHEPFEWGFDAGDGKMNAAQAKLFDEASEYGICCGLTIPIHDAHGSMAAVTFASDKRCRIFRNSIARNRRVLQLMAMMLHAHIRQKLWHGYNRNGKRLSQREWQCLRWAAEGKSAWAIARILGISDATVRFHLANVRKKLDVSSVRQAIMILNQNQSYNE